MKKILSGLITIMFLVTAGIQPVMAATNAELEKRIEVLEKLLKAAYENPAMQGEKNKKNSAEVKELSDRVRQLEEQPEKNLRLGTWAEKLTLSGLIEVETNYSNYDFDAPGTSDEDSTDIALATVELGIDADIAKHVGGHILLKWEDGSNGVDVDEGFIILDGKDVVPLYLNAGKMYVPFGYYESHFISDPLTLEIGETNEAALKFGYATDWIDVSLSAFNGDVDETGDSDHIDDFAASLVVTPDISEAFGIAFGVSYITNIGESNGLEGEITGAGTVKDDVPGVGAFLSFNFKERFFLELEYVSALDDFKPGELSFDNGNAFEPVAWNIEFAFLPIEDLELAVRYEGGNDLGSNFLPERRYGAAASYGLFPYTTLAVEYLHADFENNDKSDNLTVQLGIEF